MSASRRPRMTADAYIAWAMTRPEGERYELVAGELVAMSPERAGHNEGKGDAYVALRQAIRKHRLPCWAYTDGMAVRVDGDTVYETDVLVRCGDGLDADAVVVTDPVILVEVISPSTHKVDTHQKLGDYFRLASVRHYLIVNTNRRTVVHHERAEGDEVRTRIATGGELRLIPPGLVLEVAALFPDGPG
jgi:Uma2 family endonuclease